MSILNLTPHDVILYDEEGKTILSRIPKSGVVCRMNQAEQAQAESVIVNDQLIPVIVSPEFTTIDGLPDISFKECLIPAICVAMPVGQHLKAHPDLYPGAVYGPDTSPMGAVRSSETGIILGTRNLVLYKEKN